jgi:hypothetical protein
LSIMLKRAASYIFIVFGLVALWASTSRSAMQFVAEKRDNDTWWGSYQGRHGDLVSMSYLDFVKKFYPGREHYSIKPPVPDLQRNTVLYLDGDSYARHLNDTAFAGVAAYHYIDRNHGANYHLDTTRKNILLIEISERYVRPYFGSLRMLDEVCDSAIKKKNIARLGAMPRTNYLSVGMPVSVDDLFNKYINQNLQANLFNYNFVMPMFESKAALNYYLFNRASGDVVISKDRNFLFLKETVSRTDVGSSYSPLNTDEVSTLVTNLNTIYDHYRQNGFREVYLSVIPNSATINQPDGYNNLIPLVQNDARLRMKVIDAYTAFKQSGEGVYLSGDTHWNNRGRQLWLDIVNDTLVRHEKGAYANKRDAHTQDGRGGGLDKPADEICSAGTDRVHLLLGVPGLSAAE